MDDILTFKKIRNNSEIRKYLDFLDNASEYGMEHAIHSANTAEHILKFLGYDKREQELAKIAAYVHDIGTIISKKDHDQNGAIMFLNILGEDKCNEEVFMVVNAIGCHEDQTVDPVSPIAAALILSDKTDVCHERLKVEDLYHINKISNVIAACQKVDLLSNKKRKTIELRIKIDTKKCSVMDYFEFFLSRMNYCRRASNVLDCNFGLYINKDKFL
ncbi:MAG: HD domain-containing protein [Endomicrobium sp.]|jgi:HD superfamily phosphodiesterase|nr:HD domain-containing protein [Endomicrobium sp.]